MEKRKMRTLLLALTILVGAVLTTYMISVGSEPGEGQFHCC